MTKIILVTGATRGLGLSIVKNLLSRQYHVIATGRKITNDLSQLIEDYPEHLSFKPFDLSKTEDIKTFMSSINKKHGRLYGLINNAALGHDGVLATMHESEINQLIKVNIEAPILLAKYASRHMLINQTGRIINISSIIASTGFNGLSVYAASKSALNGFTRSLSRELGKSNITVNCIAPGYMATEMTSGLQDEKLASIIRRSPMKKLVEPKDVAHSIAYLLSDEARLITGTTMTVDAGSTA